MTTVVTYSQLLVSGTLFDDNSDNVPDLYPTALDDALRSRRFVGTCAALVTVVTPGQYNPRTPVHLEVWPQRPPDDSADWDHEVDIDIDAAEGYLTFEHLGGAGPDALVEVPPVRYRMCISGRGFDALGTAGSHGPDCYRLRLFPRRRSMPPRLRRAWPGWTDFS